MNKLSEAFLCLLALVALTPGAQAGEPLKAGDSIELNRRTATVLPA